MEFKSFDRIFKRGVADRDKGGRSPRAPAWWGRKMTMLLFFKKSKSFIKMSFYISVPLSINEDLMTFASY